MQAGQSLTFSGTVTPDHTGHVIFLERHNVSGTGFHVVQVGTLGAGSSFSIKHTVYDPGTKVFRVTIPGGPENEGASSPPFTITVTPAPAAALTAEPPGNSSLPAEGRSLAHSEAGLPWPSLRGRPRSRRGDAVAPQDAARPAFLRRPPRGTAGARPPCA